MANALLSRPVLITTSVEIRGLFRISDNSTQSREINQTVDNSALFRRVYKRALN